MSAETAERIARPGRMRRDIAYGCATRPPAAARGPAGRFDTEWLAGPAPVWSPPKDYLGATRRWAIDFTGRYRAGCRDGAGSHRAAGDDLDGSEATQSISFGLDGVTFGIDLNEQHAGELRAALDAYVRAARRVGRPTGGVDRRDPRRSSVDRNAAIRQWALDNGIELPGRGRIAHGVQDAYDAGDVAALYTATGLEMDE